jgi:hypothetical protein
VLFRVSVERKTYMLLNLTHTVVGLATYLKELPAQDAKPVVGMYDFVSDKEGVDF